MSLQNDEPLWIQERNFTHALLENVEAGVVACDESGRLVLFNRVARNWHGVDVRDIPPQEWSQFYSLYEDDGVTPMTVETIPLLRANRGETLSNVPMVISAAGKSPRHVLASGSPIFDVEGRQKGAVVIMIDVTALRMAERQLLRSQRMESIGTLAGGIAHDLNNMLAPILMAMGLLKTQIRDPQALSVLATIDASARRAASLVKQVLQFARGMDAHRAELNLEDLISELKGLLLETFPRQIRIHYTYAPDVWKVVADPTQIHQVMLNLCLNARDAMPQGGDLRIAVRNALVNPNFQEEATSGSGLPYVRISVSDSGCGIDPALLDRLFDPFFTTKDPGKGTGLGLPTSRSIVEAHGGFFQVESQLNRGSQFAVYLPVASAGFGKQLPVEIAKTHLPRGNGQTIMVIDDEPAMRDMTRRILETFGYSVVLASDGAQAVAAFVGQSERIAAVITDLNMPVMDGSATIRTLRQLKPDLAVIATSGRSSDEVIKQSLDTGANFFLAKPCSAESLLQIIDEALQSDGQR